MYLIKENMAELIKEKYKLRYIANKSMISESYLSLLINQKARCSKKTALLIANSIDSNVEDIFISVK